MFNSFYLNKIKPNILSILLNNKTLQFKRNLLKLQRNKNNKKPILKLFISIDDIQSFLLLKCTLKLINNYNINIKIYLLPLGINGWSINLKEKYNWIINDCGLFSSLYLLKEEEDIINKNKNKKEYNDDKNKNNLYQSINLKITEVLSNSNFLDNQFHNEHTINNVLDCFRQAWSNQINEEDKEEKETKDEINLGSIENLIPELDYLNQNHTLLRKLGYYNPGAIEMEGEWYPPNRLHYLERRLLQEGFYFLYL